MRLVPRRRANVRLHRWRLTNSFSNKPQVEGIEACVFPSSTQSEQGNHRYANDRDGPDPHRCSLLVTEDQNRWDHAKFDSPLETRALCRQTIQVGGMRRPDALACIGGASRCRRRARPHRITYSRVNRPNARASLMGMKRFNPVCVPPAWNPAVEMPTTELC